MSEQQQSKSSDDGLRQRLTEFIYGLLPDEETAALNERIASDPKVARIYAEVKLDTDLFAKAARLEEKQLPRKMRLARPAAGVPTSGALAGMTAGHWVLALAAAVLIAVTLGGWAYQEATEQSIADKHLHLVVSGPARLKQGIDNQFQISTRTVDGDPVAADLEYTIASAAGEELYSNLQENNPLKLVRDDRGDAILTIPASIELPPHSRLEIRAFHEQSRPRMTQSLPVDEDHFVTWLSLDKPWYQPGETVSYRSLTLTRFSLNAKQDLPVQYEILDPGGAPIADAASAGVTHNGVGNGGWQIPDGAAGGQYTIVCRSVDDSFPEQTKQFLVRRYALPRLKKELEFVRDTYTPGDEVIADVSVNRAEGDAAAEAPIRVIATVDDVEVFNDSAQLSTTGTYQVKFPLPATMERGDGQLAVIVDDGGTRETIARTIPINLGKVDVQFFPEGGDLVAGVENRVYFVAKNPQGEPVHIEGHVVNDKGQKVADFATMHEGLGKLAFTPADGAKYHVEVTKPADISSQPTLPAVNDKALLAINTGDGVFAADEHPALTIHAAEAGIPLVVSAVCRGTAVGQTRHVTVAGQPQNIVVPVNDAAEGVVRLTVFDYSTQPATPLAERLVYRRPNRKLNVEINAASAQYAPGQQAEVHLRVTDENGQPVPATLGVSVVDDALLSLKRETDKHKLVAMPTHFLLTTEVDKPEDLEDANFFLSDEPDAAGALDLLLGTQGWRRFAEKTREELLLEDLATVAAPAGEGSEPSAAATQLANLDRLVAMDGAIVAPAAFDNLAVAQSEYQAELAAYQAKRQDFYNLFGKIAFGGGLLLIFAVAVMALSRVASRVSFWAPTLAASVACLLVGAFWIARDVDGNLSLSPQALFRSQADQTVAMAPTDEARRGAAHGENAELELFGMDDAMQFEGALEMALDDAIA
ncbi:MAG: MG2 domain-containing protein, partial [Pirellulales bacterium]